MDQSITFESNEAYGGIGICTGTLRFSPGDAALHLEWQIKDGIAGVLKSGLKTRTIPISEISSTSYKSGLFRGKIALRTHSMSIFHDIPGSQGNTLFLKTPRRDRILAKRLVSELNLHLSQRDLDRVTSATGLPS